MPSSRGDKITTTHSKLKIVDDLESRAYALSNELKIIQNDRGSLNLWSVTIFLLFFKGEIVEKKEPPPLKIPKNIPSAITYAKHGWSARVVSFLIRIRSEKEICVVHFGMVFESTPGFPSGSGRLIVFFGLRRP